MEDQIESSIDGCFDIVLSDMAPSTTGNKWLDTVKSHELSRTALKIADSVLVEGGNFACKIFQGEDFKEFSDSVKKRFKRHKIIKPQSSRKASREIFVIGMGKKQEDKRCQDTVNGQR